MTPKPLEIAHAHPRTRRTVREEAEFMAREIFDDVQAPVGELADAIELAIIRFARDLYLTPRQRDARARDGGMALTRFEEHR
jgi:hypothetical protein